MFWNLTTGSVVGLMVAGLAWLATGKERG